MWCGSRWELAFLIWALDNHTDVTRCKLKIPYTYNRWDRHYHPDFVVDGKIHEIKGYYDPYLEEKLKAAKRDNIEITLIESVGVYRKYSRQTYGLDPFPDYKKFYDAPASEKPKKIIYPKLPKRLTFAPIPFADNWSRRDPKTLSTIIRMVSASPSPSQKFLEDRTKDLEIVIAHNNG